MPHLDYGLVERRWPFTVANPERTRQNRYVSADNSLARLFRFVLPNRSTLEKGQVRSAWEQQIAPCLSEYMGSRFEAACRQFIRLTPERWTGPTWRGRISRPYGILW